MQQIYYKSTAATAAVTLAAVYGASSVEAISFFKGVAPVSFPEGFDIYATSNALTSHMKVMPMPWDSMPWCKVEETLKRKHKKKLNLGEVMWGNKIEPTHYKFTMKEDATCTKLCDPIPLDEEGRKVLTQRIEDNYRGNLQLDSLPLVEEGSGILDNSPIVKGFPLGISLQSLMEKIPTMSAEEKSKLKAVVYNHLAFSIKYHAPEEFMDNPDFDVEDLESKQKEVFLKHEKMWEEGKHEHTYRIVGFEVTPMSIDHEKRSCDNKMVAGEGKGDMPHVTVEAKQITWSYSVRWEQSDIEWSTRWDAFMKTSKAETRIHAVSIVNSVLVVLLLSSVVAVIIAHALKKDVLWYADDSLSMEERDVGWKQVHMDVFRPPEESQLLCILVGSGTQLLCMATAVLALAVMGIASPQRRGSIFTGGLFLFVVLGVVCGYIVARFAKYFNCKSWKLVFLAGVFLPGQMFIMYFIMNLIHWGSKAASATPFTSMMTIAALWMCVSIPLVMLGGAIGYRQEVMTMPRKVSPIERTIPPQPWYLDNTASVILPGILPFGSAFIESAFILNSVWQGRVYTMFGFCALVFIILVITTAEACIVMAYFQLMNYDYHWWWRSFSTGASYGFWFYLYGMFYYATGLTIRTWWSSVLYLGYMAMVSYAMACMTGAIGFLATFFFIRRIYGSVKVD